MKANEAPKSKFVYPDRLYAMTKDNITLDISYAPHTLEAVEYTRTDVFIDKTCNAYCMMYKTPKCKGEDCKYIKDFRKYMEEE